MENNQSQNREIIMIKKIDWISKIMAVLLGSGGSFGMFHAEITKPKYEVDGTIYAIILWLTLQLGLFLAPAVREKGIICRSIIAILMFPNIWILFNIVILKGTEILKKTGSCSPLFILMSIGLIVYLTQYYLLFKGKKVNTINYSRLKVWILVGVIIMVMLIVGRIHYLLFFSNFRLGEVSSAMTWLALIFGSWCIIDIILFRKN